MKNRKIKVFEPKLEVASCPLFHRFTKIHFYCNWIALWAVVLIVSGCNKEKEKVAYYSFNVQYISGIYYLDMSGYNHGVIGVSPVVRQGVNDETGQMKYRFITYPTIGRSFNIMIANNPKNLLKRLWVVPAILEVPIPGYSFQTDWMNNLIPGSAALMEVEFFEDIVNLNLWGLPEGFYRIFIELDGNLLFDNILVGNIYYVPNDCKWQNFEDCNQTELNN